MKILETHFDGYHFRSRLEARWAVFFKTVGIAYEYEKEGYDLDGVWYLPDFWLPEKELWYEIKGKEPTGGEIQKVRRLTKHTQKRAVICWGAITLTPKDRCRNNFTYYLSPNGQVSGSGGNWWCECPHCHAIGFTDPEMYTPAICACSYRFPHLAPFDLMPQENTPRLNAAFTAARSARFEKGK